MKKITIIIAVLIKISIFAQPVLNSTDISTTGSLTATTLTASATGFSAGSAGSNQVWDYSSLILTPAGTGTTTVVATTPFAASFPDANLIYKATFGTDSFYTYYKLTTTKQELVGYSSDTNVIINFSPNPQTVYSFPYTYGLIVNDTYSTTFDPSANNPFSITYDAYGTLITPYGIFNNVIRSKKLDGIAPDYTWFTTNPFQVILTASISSTGVASNVKFSQPSNLSTIQNTLYKQFEIYPNPTSGSFTIKNIDFSNNENFLNAYDVLGNQIINNQKIDSDSKDFDLNNAACGLYFIKITNKNNNILFSYKIIKN
jgi:Secretion system C-terminal sorting domain